MNADILKGTAKAKPVHVYHLKKDSAKKLADKRGRKTNRDQKEGRKQRHDHPARPTEQHVKG